MNPSDNQHKLRHLFELSRARVLRVSFLDGMVFRLRGSFVVDHSIYGDTDKWCAEIVEAVSGSHPDFKRLFCAGDFLDFVESDIHAIHDDESGQLLHERHETNSS